MFNKIAAIRWAMDMGPDIAAIASAIGDPVRAAMLAALVDGRSLPAGELALVGNVSPQTASFHLSKLVDCSLVCAERQGRHHYYRLADEQVASALESLAAISPLPRCLEAPDPRNTRLVPGRELRYARSCYKHLAGALAVEMNQALLERELTFASANRTYTLTDGGRRWCRDVGIALPDSAKARETAARACLDWTERRHHLGGPLGVALFALMKELGWLAANPRSRAVRVTHAGARALEKHFGIASRV